MSHHTKHGEPSLEPPPAAAALVLPAIVHFALDVVDHGKLTTFGALHDARTELRVTVDGGMELADKATSAALRFARKLIQRLDELAGESLVGAERVLTRSVASARSSAIAATERLASRAPAAVGAAAPAPAN